MIYDKATTGKRDVCRAVVKIVIYSSGFVAPQSVFIYNIERVDSHDYTPAEYPLHSPDLYHLVYGYVRNRTSFRQATGYTLVGQSIACYRVIGLYILRNYNGKNKRDG